MKVDLGEVLTRAWQITWKHKMLWGISALPLLISFLFYPLWLVLAFTQDFDSNRIEGLVENPSFIIVGGVFYVLIIVGSSVLQVMSRSSVTLGVYRIETESQPITFMDLLRDGLQYFWRILGVILLIGLAIVVVFLAFFACVAALSVVTMGFAALCLQPLFLLMIPLTWLVTAGMEQAEAAVIADGMGVTDAVKRAYELVRSNLGSYALITLVIYFGVGILSSLIVFPFMVPMFVFMMRNMESGVMDINNMMRTQSVLGTVILPVFVFIQGVTLTYLKTAMTITYLRLTRAPHEPQLVLQEASA